MKTRYKDKHDNPIYTGDVVWVEWDDMEYIEDSRNSAMEWSEIWATVDAVHVQKGINKVFVDCDLSRL